MRFDFRSLRPIAIGAAAALVATTFLAPMPARAQSFQGTYVALGDSYTSGPGITPYKSDSGLCARSSRNYPSVVAARIRPTVFRDVSCGGAVTDTVTSSQLAAVDANTRLVTLGIGGNDAGLLGAAITCVILAVFDPTGSPCKNYYTSGGTDRLLQTVNTAMPKVRTLIGAIKQRAPQARVLLVGYPTLVPRSKSQCAPGVTLPQADGDVLWSFEEIGRINEIFRATATAAGAEYVDTYTTSIGHDTCQAPGVRYVEGLSQIQDGSILHPNGTGMAAWGAQIATQLGY